MAGATKKVVVTIEKLPCKCTSAFQDARYGKGIRLHTVCTAPMSVEKRCTVCYPNTLMKWTVPFPEMMLLPPRSATVRIIDGRKHIFIGS